MGVLATGIGIWIIALVGSGGPMRQAAVDSLIKSGQVKAVAQAVYENNWRTREGLIEALERMGAVLELADIAERHSKLDAQRLAIRGLGRTGKKEAQGTLRYLLASENRDLAIEALAQVGDASDIGRARELLRDDRPDVRRRAMLALVKLGKEASLGALVSMLGDPHHSVRFAAFDPLVSFGIAGADQVLGTYEQLPRVGKQLAVRLFGKLRYRPGEAILRRALVGESWPLQLAAASAMGMWGDPKWIPILKEAQKPYNLPIVAMAIQDAMQEYQ